MTGDGVPINPDTPSLGKVTLSYVFLEDRVQLSGLDTRPDNTTVAPIAEVTCSVLSVATLIRGATCRPRVMPPSYETMRKKRSPLMVSMPPLRH